MPRLVLVIVEYDLLDLINAYRRGKAFLVEKFCQSKITCEFHWKNKQRIRNRSEEQAESKHFHWPYLPRRMSLSFVMNILDNWNHINSYLEKIGSKSYLRSTKWLKTKPSNLYEGLGWNAGSPQLITTELTTCKDSVERTEITVHANASKGYFNFMNLHQITSSGKSAPLLFLEISALNIAG